MKKLFIPFFCLTLISTSCKKEKELIEVTIPEPEKIEAKTLGNPNDVKAEDEEGAFQMIKLPYAYNAMEPFFDSQTMETHYSKHHLSYCNKLNAAVKDTPMASLNIEELLKKLDLNNVELRNNAGGFYNHNLFFEILGQNTPEPKDEILEAINTDLGSFENFKNDFTDKSLKLFGSGWIWLIVDKSGKLAITSTINQDNPLMKNAEIQGTPILALDVWEHAYYLKYQNKRKDYIGAYFNIINWKKVNEKYKEAIAKINS